MIGFLKY